MIFVILRKDRPCSNECILQRKQDPLTRERFHRLPRVADEKSVRMSRMMKYRRNGEGSVDFVKRSKSFQLSTGCGISKQRFGKKRRKILLRKLRNFRPRDQRDVCSIGINVDNTAITGFKEKHLNGRTDSLLRRRVPLNSYPVAVKRCPMFPFDRTWQRVGYLPRNKRIPPISAYEERSSKR